MSRVIFLDVDGVLNSDPFLMEHGLKGEWPDAHIDPSRVTLLSSLVRQTDALVVLSSAWRQFLTINEFNDLLSRHGYEGSAVIDRTPVMHQSLARSEEIRQWLTTSFKSTWPQVNYVIIDDSRDADDRTGRFVQTDPILGLTEENVAQAIKILNGS